MIQRIALVGMMGAGKSVVGRLLAEHLRIPFFDLDDEIEKVEGRSIAEIFAERGEGSFREIESARLREAVRSETAVIATGGGVLIAEENRDLLSRWGRTVYLRAPVAILAARVGAGAGAERPLLAAGPIEARLAAILADRTPLYEAADHVVDTEGLTAGDVARRIEEWVKGSAQPG